MKAVKVKDFSLKATLESGQVFRWEKAGEWYYIITGDVVIKIKQQNNELFYTSNKGFDVLGFLACLSLPFILPYFLPPALPYVYCYAHLVPS
ncbi:hypothetical protein J4470_02810 [Candidatus Woesearchaeota archaeon]|nr:hypothetical protein [Candidatus Woesearchaeota archaeon]